VALVEGCYFGGDLITVRDMECCRSYRHVGGELPGRKIDGRR
jgi:hypothetical protein